MNRVGAGRPCLVGLLAFLLLPVIAVPDALAVELERMRESYDSTLRAHQKRITEIEAKGRFAPADPEKRAEGITRDRVAGMRASLKSGGGTGKRLAELAEKASVDAKELVDVYNGQSEHLDVVTREWGANGTERQKLREALTVLEKNLALTRSSLAMAAAAAGALTTQVQESGVFEKVASIEGAGSEARERLSARWERERAAREREREQRAREAAERTRGLR